MLEAIKSVREKEPEKWKPMGEVERNLMMKIAKKKDIDKLRQNAETKKIQKEMEKQKAEEGLKKIGEEKKRLADEEKKIAMELTEIERRNQDEISNYERAQEEMRKREEEKMQKFEQERQRLLMLQQEAERRRQEAEVSRYQREQQEMRKMIEEENKRLKSEKERMAKEREEIKRKNLEIVRKYQEEQDTIKEKKEKEESAFTKEQDRIAKDIEKMLKAYQNELAKYQKEQDDADRSLEMQMKEAEREKERRNREREEKRKKELAMMEQRVTEYGRRGDLNVDRLFSSIDRHIGIPYRFGGDSASGIDCSAFTRRVYREQGVELPRTSREQAMVGMDAGNLLIPGDLIFFNTSIQGTISHVGVYMDNNTFAHASSSQGVTKSSIRERYFSKRYVRANRIFE
ncbi:MAG: C40 family peptidase [Nitrospinae bacterium]|nr:C40 family peptidase [Nitrospinota bacterium]